MILISDTRREMLNEMSIVAKEGSAKSRKEI